MVTQRAAKMLLAKHGNGTLGRQNKSEIVKTVPTAVCLRGTSVLLTLAFHFTAALRDNNHYLILWVKNWGLRP